MGRPQTPVRFSHRRRRIEPRPHRTPSPPPKPRAPHSPPRPHVGTHRGGRPHRSSPRWRPAGPTRTSGPAPGWPRRHRGGSGWGRRGSPKTKAARRRRWRPELSARRGRGGGPRAAPWRHRYGGPSGGAMAVGRAWRVGQGGVHRGCYGAPYRAWGAPPSAPRCHRVTAPRLPAPLLGQERGRGGRKRSPPPPRCPTPLPTSAPLSPIGPHH